MSFILDALKKSESDRQRKSSPDISDVPTAVRPSGTPRWLWVLSGLLAINVLVLLVVLLKPGAVPTSSVPRSADEPERGTTAAVATLDAPAEDSGPARTELLPSVEPDTGNAEPVAADRPPEPAASARAVAVAEAAVADRAPTETYLTFNDLKATGNLSLPDLHIDLHVYSDNPTERFVFINMNQYRENATLTEGPHLRQITTEGVILEYVGTTFLLPRE